MTKKSCDGCANRGKDCLTMLSPPAERFCYKTLEGAIETEHKLIEYASRTQTASGLSSYRENRDKRIKELEEINGRRVRKIICSDL